MSKGNGGEEVTEGKEEAEGKEEVAASETGDGSGGIPRSGSGSALDGLSSILENIGISTSPRTEAQNAPSAPPTGSAGQSPRSDRSLRSQSSGSGSLRRIAKPPPKAANAFDTVQMRDAQPSDNGGDDPGIFCSEVPTDALSEGANSDPLDGSGIADAAGFGTDDDELKVDDVVIVTKIVDGVKSVIYGEAAVVTDPDWNGLVKIQVKTGPYTGDIKSYKKDHLSKMQHDNVEFQLNDLAIVTKIVDGVKSIIHGETVQVIDPDWHGVVKIRVKTGPHTGDVKSYKKEHLAPLARTKIAQLKKHESEVWFEEARSSLNDKCFYLHKIKAMHRDTKASKSTEYYTRPFVDLRPDFVLRVQKALFLVLCEFFDSNIAAHDLRERTKSDDESSPTSPFDKAVASMMCCGRSHPSTTADNSGGLKRRPSRRQSFSEAASVKQIHRCEVNLHSPEIFRAQQKLLALFFDWLKQTVEHCLIDDINPIRFALAAQGAMISLADKERIDHGCEATGSTEHTRHSVIKLYRAHVIQISSSFQLLAAHFGALATNLLEFLPSSGREAGRIMKGLLEVGNPSSIQLAESNKNLDFLVHDLVAAYIGIVWEGMLWERCFLDFDGEKYRTTWAGKAFNPFAMPKLLSRSQGSDVRVDGLESATSPDEWGWVASELWYGDESWSHGASTAKKIVKVAADFHDRLTRSAKEMFAPARYLKSPAARYSIEVSSYIATAVLHVGVLFSDSLHCDDAGYGFTRYDLGLGILTFGHAMNEVEAMTASFRHREEYSVSGSPIITIIVRYFSNIWNLADLSVAGISLLYFILKWIQTMDEWTCWALHTTPRDLLSLNCVLLSLRLLHTLLVDKKMGPVVSALTLVIGKVISFLLVWVTITMGFAGTFNVLFPNVEGHDTWQNSFFTLVFAALGRLEFGDLIEGAPFWGPVLLILYDLVAVVLLLSCLIAVLTETFEEVQKNSLKEWCLLKTREYCRLEWDDSVGVANGLPPPFNVLLIALIPLKLVLVATGSSFKYRGHADSFVTIVGFELLLAVPGIVYFMLSTVVTLAVEYLLFVPQTLVHAVAGTAWHIDRVFDPKDEGWTTCGAGGAFVLGVPCCLVMVLLQVVVATALLAVNLLLSPFDMVVGLWRSFASIDEHHLIDATDEEGRSISLRHTLNIMEFEQHSVEDACARADAVVNELGKNIKQQLYEFGRAEELLTEGMDTKDEKVASLMDSIAGLYDHAGANTRLDAKLIEIWATEDGWVAVDKIHHILDTDIAAEDSKPVHLYMQGREFLYDDRHEAWHQGDGLDEDEEADEGAAGEKEVGEEAETKEDQQSSRSVQASRRNSKNVRRRSSFATRKHRLKWHLKIKTVLLRIVLRSHKESSDGNPVRWALICFLAAKQAMENAKTLEYRHELSAAMRVLQDTASHLIEHISDPQVVSQCFLSSAAAPSVFDLAVESEATTFLNTKQARVQIDSQWMGPLLRNLDSDVLDMLVKGKFIAAYNHGVRQQHELEADESERGPLARVCGGPFGLCGVWRALATLAVRPARYLKSPFARFVIDCITFFIHLALHQMSTSRCGNAGCGGRFTRDLLTLFLFGFFAQKLIEYIVFGPRAFLADRWNVIDVGVIVVYFGSMMIRFIEDSDRYGDTFGTEEHPLEEKIWYKLLAINSLLLWLRILSVFSISRRFGPMLFSFIVMGERVILFVCIIVIISLGFAGWFVAWLGLNCDEQRCPGDWIHNETTGEKEWVVDEDLNQYSTFAGATLTLVQAMLGDFEQEPIALGGNLTGRSMMTLYLIITTVTLLNLLVAVVNQVYAETEQSGNEDFMLYKALQTQKLSDLTHNNTSEEYMNRRRRHLESMAEATDTTAAVTSERSSHRTSFAAAAAAAMVVLKKPTVKTDLTGSDDGGAELKKKRKTTRLGRSADGGSMLRSCLRYLLTKLLPVPAPLNLCSAAFIFLGFVFELNFNRKRVCLSCLDKSRDEEGPQEGALGEAADLPDNPSRRGTLGDMPDDAIAAIKAFEIDGRTASADRARSNPVSSLSSCCSPEAYWRSVNTIQLAFFTVVVTCVVLVLLHVVAAATLLMVFPTMLILTMLANIFLVTQSTSGIWLEARRGDEPAQCPGMIKPFVYLLQLALAPLIATTVGVGVTVLLVLGILAVILPVTPMVFRLALDVPSWSAKAPESSIDDDSPGGTTSSPASPEKAMGSSLRNLFNEEDIDHEEEDEKNKFKWTDPVVQGSITQALAKTMKEKELEGGYKPYQREQAATGSSLVRFLKPGSWEQAQSPYMAERLNELDSPSTSSPGSRSLLGMTFHARSPSSG